MPRKFEVNKKLKVLKYTCKIFNLENQAFYEKVCYSKYLVLQEPIKFCRKKLETESEKVVEVLQIEQEILYYGMTMDDYMKYGTKLNSDGSASDEDILAE